MPAHSLSIRLAFPLAAALLLGACSGYSAPSTAGGTAPPKPGATATIANAQGEPVGEARFFQTADGIDVELSARGLPPGEHGAHVHMTGRCDPPSFASAGGHWNPTAHQHGLKNPQGAHMGDMPNLVIGADGTGTLRFSLAGGTIEGGANPLLDADGAAMMIHAGPDDMMSDPAGNSGGRVACGVIVKQ